MPSEDFHAYIDIDCEGKILLNRKSDNYCLAYGFPTMGAARVWANANRYLVVNLIREDKTNG